MVLLGRPKNGDIVRAQLRIKESKEFKVSEGKEKLSLLIFSSKAQFRLNLGQFRYCLLSLFFSETQAMDLNG